MQLKSIPALLALAITASGLAVKQPTGGPTGENVTRPIGEDVAQTTLLMHEYCDMERLQSPEGAKRVWIQSGAAQALDKWVTRNGSPRWLKNLAMGINPGSPSVDGCSRLDGTNCDPLDKKNCFDLYVKAEEKKKTESNKSEDDDDSIDSDLIRAAFWIFTAADRVKQKIDATHKSLLERDMVGKLQIDEIVKDLGGTPNPGQDMGKWLSLSLNALNSFAGVVSGPASTGFGLITGIFTSAVDAVDSEKVDITDSLETALASLLNEAVEKLEEQLELALGAPDQQDQYKELDKYIRLASGLQTPVTQVGKFFAQGPWLMDYDEIGDDEEKQFLYNLRQKLAHEAIKAEGFQLLIDDYSTSKKSCGHRAGNQWLELDGKYYCAYLSKGGMTSVFLPSEDYYNNMMPKYGLGLREPYYKNVLDCGLRSGNKKDIDSQKLVGGYPSCWFPMDLIYVGPCTWRARDKDYKKGHLSCIESIPNDL